MSATTVVHSFPSGFAPDPHFPRALRVFLLEQGLPASTRAGELTTEQLREVTRRAQNLKDKATRP